VKTAVRQIETEAALYENGGHVTYFADEYLLDVLADTTERTPTFTTPPFRPQKNKNAPLSWAFVKNPFLNTVSAWRSCFERTPRCLDRSAAEYRALGIKEADIQRIPPISLDDLYEFEIGNEPDPEREGEKTLSTWVGYGEDAPKEYFERAKRFAAASVWTVGDTELLTARTRMKLFEHLAMKMMLNSVSTLTMAKLGRIRGNYMAHLNISNKKLVDRATRMIADLCDVDYETANYELFYSKLLLESFGKTTSTTVETIDRLGQKHE
jgi:N-acetylmuramic acid 6-phosphate etherase